MAADILAGDLEEAATLLADRLPDVAAAFDIVVPTAFAGELGAARRFTAYYVLVTERIAEDVESLRPDIPASVVDGLLRSEIVSIPLVAPTPSACGVLVAMVSRARWISGVETPALPVRPFDPDAWARYRRAIEAALIEQERSTPLERAMTILDLNSSEVGEIMGVSRQAIDKWLLSGVPADRSTRVVTIAEIATIMHRRLRPGHVPGVVRRPAPMFGGESFLELMMDGREDEVLAAVRASFDFASVA
jgi:hypothetical protein